MAYYASSHILSMTLGATQAIIAAKASENLELKRRQRLRVCVHRLESQSLRSFGWIRQDDIAPCTILAISAFQSSPHYTYRAKRRRPLAQNVPSINISVWSRKLRNRQRGDKISARILPPSEDVLRREIHRTHTGQSALSARAPENERFNLRPPSTKARIPSIAG